MSHPIDAEKEKLLEKIAQLEFANDQMTTELEYVDTLLRSAGFADGLESVKAAAQELNDYERHHEMLFEDGLPDEPPGLYD